MPADAKVQRTEELSTYYKFLGDFLESMSKNMTAFDYMMMQKLQVLRKLRDEMEDIEKMQIAECARCEKDFAYCPSDNVEEQRKLLARLKNAEHKRSMAQEVRNRVSTQFNVAQGAIRCMLENTKSIQKHINSDVAKGQHLLKDALLCLEQYKNTQNQ